ncbi:hypothetical protein ACH4TQ_09960 [Streptomyces sp. NPDC021218]|uniref:hypothetical protein n=1 Tax=unclassified Streptomyces TaxID=2593676 RepID=UPI0036B52B34
MNTTASFARREWGPLYTTVRAAVAARGWRVVPLTLPVLTRTHTTSPTATADGPVVVGGPGQ